MAVESWARMINGMCGINHNHVCQLHSSKSGYDSDLQKFNAHSRSIVREIVNSLRHRGLEGLNSKTLKPHKWPMADGQKIAIHRIKKNNIRILYSHIMDDPESSSRIPVIYLHNVFIKRGDQQYSKYLKRISKSNDLKYEMIDNPKPTPDIVKNEIWKTKDSYPYVATSDEDYELLKDLAKNSDMAVFPTMDQINAISQPKRPLFINGQAGTGKTTGLSWILSLRIPFDLSKKNGNRILVTAMTETVIEKLKNNTKRLFEIRYHYLEKMFGLNEGAIPQHIEKSFNSECNWYSGEKFDESVGMTTEGGPDIVFLNFKQILLDIASLSKKEIRFKLEYYQNLIDNKQKCSTRFDIDDETSVKNRSQTCKFCLENPRFHIDWENMKNADISRVKMEVSNYRKLNDIISLIENDKFDSQVTYSNFLIEFFSNRNFEIEPEFAWYGIRTLIKGYSVKNNYTPLNKSNFQDEKILKPAISDDFDGKLDQLYECYEKYNSWLKQNEIRDDMDLVTDVAFLLDVLKSDEGGLIENKFDQVLLDEAQDLTNVEYEVLLYLLKAGKKSEVVFAGDPLQTINPTGFDWNRMKDLMYGLGENQDGLSDPQILNHNWRTPRSIVEISNGILGLREKVISNEKVQKQEAHEPGMKPVLIYLSDKSGNYNVDRDLLERFLTTKSAYKVTVRKSDKRGLEDLIEKDNLIEPKKLKINHNLHTVTEIKGDEAANIVLYRTGEMGPDDLNKLLSTKEDIKAMDNGTRIRLKFIINQLYILTTRSNEKMYIIESDRHRGRIWETLFADLIEVDEVPDDVLQNILTIADKDFNLNDWAKEQLKLWKETKELKFLTWAVQEFEKEKKSKVLAAHENVLYHRIKAHYSQEKGELAKAGEHWEKAGEHKTSFSCFVSARDWSKAKNSRAKDAKDYLLILDFLENENNINSAEKFLELFDLATNIFDSETNKFPRWVKEFDKDIIQFLFNKIIESKRHGDYIVPREKIKQLNWKSCNKRELEVTLHYLHDQALKSGIETDVEILENFIKDIDKIFPIVSTETQQKFVLDYKLSKTPDFTGKQNEVLTEIISLHGLSSKDSNIYKCKLICNSLELINFESKDISRAFVSELKKSWYGTKAFLEHLSTAIESQMKFFRDILVLIGCDIDTSEAKIPPFVSSLITTTNSNFISKNFSKDNHKVEFGPNTRRYFEGDDFKSLVYSKISSLLLSINPEQFNHDPKMGKLFLEFNWKNDAHAYRLGEMFVRLEKNMRNQHLIDFFLDWLKEKLTLENYHENSQLMKILQMIIDSEDDFWRLEFISKELQNVRLSQRLEMEKIIFDAQQNDDDNFEQNDDALRNALSWFRKMGLNNQEKKILSLLPDSLDREIENSIDLGVEEFAQLMELVFTNDNSNKSKELMGSKITKYSKRFSLHKHVQSSLIKDCVRFTEGDINEFWNLYLGKRYLMFANYASEYINAKIAAALYDIVLQIQRDLIEIKDIGSNYIFLNKRWTDYKVDAEFDKIFSEVTLCSIVLLIFQNKMTAEEIGSFSEEINSNSIKVEKKSDMVKIILNSYNSKLEIKSSIEFIDTITRPI